MSEETKQDLTIEKFTKATAYELLTNLGNALNFASEEDKAKYVTVVEENFKPQKGGGATENPPKEIDGITYHYCRMFQDYLPESEMVFSLGKCKGISTLGQKLSYQLKKQAEATKMSAIPLFQNGDIEGGNAKMALAKEIEVSIENPQTYIDEKARLALEASLSEDVAEDSANELL